MNLDWSRPRYEAHIWWCGDDECDCTKPEIVLRTPNLTVGRPWDRLTTLWEGSFFSQASSEELAEQEAELEAECERRGIPVGYTLAHDLPYGVAQFIDDQQMDIARALGMA